MMKREQYAPHPILSNIVKSLWLIERHFQPPNNTHEILPDSSIELVFSFGASFQLDTGSVVRDLPQHFVVGLIRKPFLLRADGLTKTVGVRFWAWGFFQLFGLTIDQNRDGVQELSVTLRQLYDRLAERMLANDAAGAIERLHAFLIEQALHTQFTDDEVQTAARLLYAQHGSVTIADVAHACHLSRRQLERQFDKVVGVSPKDLAQNIRFERVRDRLWHEPGADIGALAYEYGYADQAHCIREFKRFSNRTPGQFAAEMMAAHALLSGADVAFIQDC